MNEDPRAVPLAEGPEGPDAAPADEDARTAKSPKPESETARATTAAHALAKDFAQALQAFVTALALILGGVWTYLLFVQNREKNPRALVEHAAERILLSEDRALLRASARVTNVGKVLLTVGKTTARAQQIMPLVDCATDAECPKALLLAGGSLRLGEEHIARWPTLDRWSGDQGFELEPLEAETLVFDFIIPADVQVVQFYTYLTNPTKEDKGWKNYSLHDLTVQPSETTTTAIDQSN